MNPSEPETSRDYRPPFRSRIRYCSSFLSPPPSGNRTDDTGGKRVVVKDNLEEDVGTEGWGKDKIILPQSNIMLKVHMYK